MDTLTASVHHTSNSCTEEQSFPSLPKVQYDKIRSIMGIRGIGLFPIIDIEVLSHSNF